MSLTSPPSTPPWIAAPIATTSSGLMPLCGSLPKKLWTLPLHRRHAGLAADQDRLVDLALGETGVLERGLHRRRGALDQLVDQLLQLGAGQR